MSNIYTIYLCRSDIYLLAWQTYITSTTAFYLFLPDLYFMSTHTGLTRLRYWTSIYIRHNLRELQIFWWYASGEYLHHSAVPVLLSTLILDESLVRYAMRLQARTFDDLLPPSFSDYAATECFVFIIFSSFSVVCRIDPFDSWNACMAYPLLSVQSLNIEIVAIEIRPMLS